MRVTNYTKIAAIAVCLTFTAWADDHGRSNNGNSGSSGFESGLVGSAPGLTVGGVNSGGVAWVVAAGDASISGDGRLHVEVSGLLIAGTVPPGPVKMVAASVVCGGSGGTVVASSDGTPLSAPGNAEIDTTIKLPATCFAPVVLVRVFNATPPVGGSQLGPFIALTGFNAGAAANNNNNGNNGKEGSDH